MNWDDLRIILAVFDGGSAVAAAQALGVNPTTVQRRVARFEEENGVRLFERRQSGLSPTQECEALVRATRSIEDSVSGIRREILGRDQRLEGHLVVTTTETFMVEALARHFLEFKQLHPAIELEIRLTNTRLNLSRQDADITIRPSLNPPENLVGTRICYLAAAIYVSADMAAKHGVANLRSQYGTGNWIGIGRALEAFPGNKWLRETIAAEQIVFTVDTFTAMKTAVSCGECFGILPCLLGDASPALARIDQPNPEFATAVWLLTHPEIRSAAKVSAFMKFMAAALRKDKHLFEGTET